MNKLYRFSPIPSEAELWRAFAYITVELEKLAEKLLQKQLPITILKIFPHFLDEYDYLYPVIKNMGKASPFNSKTDYYSQVSKKVSGHEISYIGVRTVDPYRMHVGCGDWEIENFAKFKKEYLGKSPYIREVADDMIELWHPDFDVLGYVVPVL